MKKNKGLVLGGILLLGIGFAAVSTTLYINGNVNISENTEDFNVIFTKAVVDSVDESGTVISEDGKTINYTTKELQALNDKSILDFEITNNSSLYDAEVSIVCTSGERGEYYQITKEVSPTVISKTTESGKVEVEKIKASTEDIEEAFTCTLNAVAKERTTKGKEPVKVNQNIVNSDLECLKNKEAGSCTPGTEIRYMVNDTTEKTFNVLHDDGKTLTLQQHDYTISNVAWYSEAEDNTKGPITALEALESATSDWDNVNTINYTMGSTEFNGNSSTGCVLSENNYNCTKNIYTLGARSAKARMITGQELISLGCSLIYNSCPTWLYGTENAYLTMSANESLEMSNSVLKMDGVNFRLSYGGTTTTDNSAHAVVVVSKYL